MFDRVTNLDGVPDGYRAMNDRESIKVTIASQKYPPRRFIAGADAIATAEQTVSDRTAQIDAYRELSSSLGFDEESAAHALEMANQT